MTNQKRIKRAARKEAARIRQAKQIECTKQELAARQPAFVSIIKPTLADMLRSPSLADLLAQPDPLIQGMLEGAAVKKGAHSDAARRINQAT